MMRKTLRAALFILPVMILLPHLSEFPFLPGATFSDLLISHYPNGLLLQRAISETLTVPLWSPNILSGYPFVANPLAGLDYLPGLLALLFPLPLGFNLLVVLHLIFGGVGMYFLLRAEGLREEAALLGGLGFEALPKLYSHLGAGHLTLLYALAWTPWLLYAENRLDAVSLNRRWRPLAYLLPGILLGVIALADIRWAAYAGLLWLAYMARVRLQLAGFKGLISGGWLASRLVNLLFAGLVAAPLLLPLAQYTALSTRSLMVSRDNLTLSLPPGQLLGLVFPAIGSPVEWMFYPGAVLFGLALYSLMMRATRQRAGFWLALTGLTLLFALGSNFPPSAWIVRLPGLDLLRVPPRVLFLTGFCLLVVAAIGFDHLASERMMARPALPENHKPQTLVSLFSRTKSPAQKKPWDWTGVVLFIVTAFALLFAAAVWRVVKDDLPKVQFGWGALFLLVGTLIITLARRRLIPLPAVTVLLVALSLIDLIGINGLLLQFHPAEAVISEREALAGYLKQQAGGQPFRVYSPSYSLPQQTAAWNGLELADGVDPLQLAAYVRFMEPATGVPSEGYSVTLPAYANADPAVDNQFAHPDAARLGLLNVRFVVADFSLDEPGLVYRSRFGDARVYENALALPRAWVQSPDAPLGTALLSRPPVTSAPNVVETRAQGPGLLVFSEMAYPGWQAEVDGERVSLGTAGGLLRALNLESGEHTVRLVFRPTLFYLGLGLAGAAWLIFVVVILLGRSVHDGTRLS